MNLFIIKDIKCCYSWLPKGSISAITNWAATGSISMIAAFHSNWEFYDNDIDQPLTQTYFAILWEY